jgi:hypothetical protein
MGKNTLARSPREAESRQEDHYEPFGSWTHLLVCYR